MTHLHPKLNWETFQKARARRKRRRWLFWLTMATTVVCLAGLVVFQYINSDSVKDARSTEHPSVSSTVSPAPTQPGAAQDAVVHPQEKMQHAAPPAEVADVQARATAKAGSAAKSQPAADHGAVASQVETTPQQATAADAPVQVAENPASAVPTVAATSAPAAAAMPAEPVHLPTESPSQYVLMENMRPLQLTLLPNLFGPLQLLPPVAPIPMPVAREMAAKAAPQPRNSALWLTMAWSPWHSREFELSDAVAALNYRALNSLNLGFRWEFAHQKGWLIALEPQLNQQRFQLQYESSFHDARYAPGSVIGYQQTAKGFEPIVADSIPGITTLRQYENGQQTDVSLPVTFSRWMQVRGAWSLGVSTGLGLNYRAGYRGSWVDAVRPISLDDTPTQLGILASGGLSLVYQPGRIRYACQVQSTYRSTVRADQLPLRNQLWFSVALPLVR